MKYKKEISFLLIVILGIILANKLGISEALKDARLIENAAKYIENNYIQSVLIFIVFTILASSILLLPGASFAVISSILYGWIYGSLYCLIGVSLGALLSFYLSRYLLREKTEKLLRKHKKLYNLLYNLSDEKEFLILMITRLVPIFPFNLQNYTYGITNISAKKYFFASSFFISPAIVFLAYFTKTVATPTNSSIIALITSFLGFLSLIYLAYTKYKRKLNKSKA